MEVLDKLYDLEYDTARLRREFLEAHKNAQPKKNKPNIQISDFTSTGKLLQDLFEKNEGLVFGEEHFDMVSSTFVIEHANVLQNLGVDSLFFEGLPYMLEKGQDGIRDESESVHPEYAKMIVKLKDLGFKIIGLDTKGAKRAGGITRDIFMNLHAGAVINTIKKQKWLALTGMMHLNNTNFIDSHTMQKHKVCGISELTGATSIILDPIGSDRKNYIKQNTFYRALPYKKVQTDFLVGINSYKNRKLPIADTPLSVLYENLDFEITYYDIDEMSVYGGTSFVFSLVSSFYDSRQVEKLKYEVKRLFSGEEIGIITQNSEITFCCPASHIKLLVNAIEQTVCHVC